MPTLKIAPKFNRCIEVTLPTGEVVVLKVQGPDADAKVLRDKIVAALTK